VFRNDKDRHQFLERLGEIFLDTKTLCYAWAVRDPGVPMSSLERELGVSILTVSDSVAPGHRIAKVKRFRLMET
jgi:hypothetical protein